MTCNQACCAMIVDENNADFRYLFYHLIAARPQLKRLATGAAQQNLSGQLIKSLTLPFPPLKEQQAIAYILGALDDKIELNRRMNETLEAMARAIFKSWFVDFLPVRAKQRARTQTGDPARAKAEGQSTELPEEIADLFPDSFEDSEIGLIPKGWKTGTIKDCCEKVQNGGTPKRSELSYL
jgi:type I restriction enzyme S subunit